MKVANFWQLDVKFILSDMSLYLQFLIYLHLVMYHFGQNSGGDNLQNICVNPPTYSTQLHCCGSHGDKMWKWLHYVHKIDTMQMQMMAVSFRYLQYF